MKGRRLLPLTRPAWRPYDLLGVRAHYLAATIGDRNGPIQLTRLFLAMLPPDAVPPASALQLAQRLAVDGRTLNSRFFRCALPSPKAYLVQVRLLYVAAWHERYGGSEATAALAHDYSSGHHLSRHLRNEGYGTWKTFTDIPRETLLATFVESYITSYREHFARLFLDHF